MKYEPSLPHNPYYIYQWNFSDGTTSNQRYVWKLNFPGLSGTLEIKYAGKGGCCKSKKEVYTNKEKRISEIS